MLTQQTCKFLLKACTDEKFSQKVPYISGQVIDRCQIEREDQLLDPLLIIDLYAHRAKRELSILANYFQNELSSGKQMKEIW